MIKQSVEEGANRIPLPQPSKSAGKTKTNLFGKATAFFVFLHVSLHSPFIPYTSHQHKGELLRQSRSDGSLLKPLILQREELDQSDRIVDVDGGYAPHGYFPDENVKIQPLGI